VAQFNDTDTKQNLLEEKLLNSHGEQWFFIEDKSIETIRQFRLDFQNGEHEDSLFLAINTTDPEQTQWKLFVGIGPRSTHIPLPNIEIRREFSVADVGGDPVTSEWSNTDDPFVAKAKEVASMAQTRRPVGHHAH